MTRERTALAGAMLPRNAADPAPARLPARAQVALRGRGQRGLRTRDNGKAMRVLMIEDEVPLAEAVARGLRREGYEVECAHDGLSGLERARESGYDAIILDILLPKMNGYKICETLRGEGIWTPILMLTAKDGEYDEAEALDTGADDFLSKPFSFVVLVARLRALLRRGAPKVAKLHIGSLTLDSARRTCRRSGSEIDLTRREFKLLEALMQRGGAVASKDDLLDEVWGPEFEGDRNIVEVYVGYLRRKIDDDFEPRMLHTVRGAGYRIVADDGT
jgi:two-component system, OmpR family, response regulator